MASLNIPPFPQFSVAAEPHSTATRWPKYLKRLENFFTAFNISSDSRKRAMLLYYAGEEVQDVFETISPAPADTYEAATAALTLYFCPKDIKNVEFERFTFRQAKQLQDESVADFNTRLQRLSQTCEFVNTEAEIKSQIIQQCTSSKLRRFALREGSKLTLCHVVSATF